MVLVFCARDVVLIDTSFLFILRRNQSSDSVYEMSLAANVDGENSLYSDLIQRVSGAVKTVSDIAEIALQNLKDTRELHKKLKKRSRKRRYNKDNEDDDDDDDIAVTAVDAVHNVVNSKNANNTLLGAASVAVALPSYGGDRCAWVIHVSQMLNYWLSDIDREVRHQTTDCCVKLTKLIEENPILCAWDYATGVPSPPDEFMKAIEKKFITAFGDNNLVLPYCFQYLRNALLDISRGLCSMDVKQFYDSFYFLGQLSLTNENVRFDVGVKYIAAMILIRSCWNLPLLVIFSSGEEEAVPFYVDPVSKDYPLNLMRTAQTQMQNVHIAQKSMLAYEKHAFYGWAWAEGNIGEAIIERVKHVIGGFVFKGEVVKPDLLYAAKNAMESIGHMIMIESDILDSKELAQCPPSMIVMDYVSKHAFHFSRNNMMMRIERTICDELLRVRNDADFKKRRLTYMSLKSKLARIYCNDTFE